MIQNKIPNKVFQDLELILNKEPEFFQVVTEAISHFASTYGEKYEANPDSPVITKKMLYHPTNGKTLTTYQTLRYMQRYMEDPTKFAKAENKNDLMKALHYILFECVRHNRVAGGKNLDIKD